MNRERARDRKPAGARSRTRLLTAALAVAATAAGCLSLSAHAQIAVRNQGYIPYSGPPINYRSAKLIDPVAKLQQQLDRGIVRLEYQTDHGYLRSVLKLLNVPADSQTLVFSKTSFQYTKISPEHPRALYFNDDVYVGSVHEGKAIEIVSFDPMQGAIFYLLDERKVAQPTFQRAELDCTQCHIAAGTRGIPGVFLRSVYPTPSGTLVPSARSFITDQESPLDERWGGWYVTGIVPGGPRHMGNAVADDPRASSAPDRGTPDPDTSAAPIQPGVAGTPAAGVATQLATLTRRFDPSTYLFPGSDVVALLVLAHQTQMHNLITLTNYKTRLALYSQSRQSSRTAAPQPSQASSPPPQAEVSLPAYVRGQFERPAEQLLRYLLFTDEAALPPGGWARLFASSTFAREFEARGPRDAEGRSLRDFDLSTRIFRYPCSYLIYSESFDAIPEPAKGYIYRRLLEVLSGRDTGPDFARLSAQDRRAILEILLATKKGLPAEWRDYARSNHIEVAANQSLDQTSFTRGIRK